MRPNAPAVSRPVVVATVVLAGVVALASCGEDPASTPPIPADISLTTDHFLITLPAADEAFRDTVARFLETGYSLYQRYSGQDVNALTGYSRYEFSYRPDDWYWGSFRMGDYAGLSVAGGPSAVRSAYVPESILPVSQTPNTFVAVTLHELGNGWWRLLNNAAGVSPLPWWLNDEGHSGFLRSAAEVEMGYAPTRSRSTPITMRMST